MKTPLSLLLLPLLASSTPLFAASPVIAHEWGTFTCLQDENGKAIGGINVDDEPVPNFVYLAGNVPIVPPPSAWQGAFGLPPYSYEEREAGPLSFCNPSVTMRLETPVLYLYPPKEQTPQSVPPLTVQVDFHGGLLGQYYPYAREQGVPKKGLTEDFTSSLTWKNVRMSATGKPIETTDKVWITPREVSASLLQVKAPVVENGVGRPGGIQTEHFLFYRGVGHLDSPLKIDSAIQSTANTAEGAQHDHSEIIVNFQNVSDRFSNYSASWLVEVRSDGTCAFISRNLSEKTPPNLPPTVSILPGWFELGPNFTFGEANYNIDNLTKLKSSMQEALVKEGLYPDEASAMLRTWELSYFKNPGLRFFYIVPRAWVDKVLPLTITGAPTEITRVMMGRIELISDQQKATFARLSAGPCPDLYAVKRAAREALNGSKFSKDEIDAFYSGEKPLSDLGITIPPLVQDYLSLGRFRDALVVHEQLEHPSPVLTQFIRANELTPATN